MSLEINGYDIVDIFIPVCYNVYLYRYKRIDIKIFNNTSLYC